jgi:very-short-patch-repair endonuclease
MASHQSPTHTMLARQLRATQTEAESLLWSVLRSRKLCGLKFRRQYPVPPFIADFACVEKKVIIELDGGYHDETYEADAGRQRCLERDGWTVLRFSNEEVLEDVDAVAIAIAKNFGFEAEFRGRKPE